jgi:hypothetical protein
MGKEANKGDGRGVFEDLMQRRKHSRLKVSALFCVFDIEMNSSHFVSRQMCEEDIHARLCSAERDSISHFSDDEWRGATRAARRMPARLDVRRVERARLCDHRGVESANDSKLLRRRHNETINSVSCDAHESGYFLEDHVPAIKTPVTNNVLARQNKRDAHVWMARKWSVKTSTVWNCTFMNDTRLRTVSRTSSLFHRANPQRRQKVDGDLAGLCLRNVSAPRKRPLRASTTLKKRLAP